MIFSIEHAHMHCIGMFGELGFSFLVIRDTGKNIIRASDPTPASRPWPNVEQNRQMVGVHSRKILVIWWTANNIMD